MHQSKIFDFQQQLRMSSGYAVSRNVEDIIKRVISGVVGVHKAALSNDKNGVDYWAETSTGQHLAIDVKIRATDFFKFGKDDLALETWSDIEKKRVGWTLDANKKC